MRRARKNSGRMDIWDYLMGYECGTAYVNFVTVYLIRQFRMAIIVWFNISLTFYE